MTYEIYESHDQERRVVEKRTMHVIVRATWIKGTWRVNAIVYQEPRSDAAIKRFLVEYPGAQALLPSTPSKP